MDETVCICSTDDISLEGVLSRQGTGQAVVLSHPHSLYGGNMDSSVICRMAQCFQSAGITTLRFNFRGVGASSGQFDNGQGEQDDVRSALAFLSEQGYDTLWLAGYSFGAWVNAHVVSAGVDVCDHIMVSPPAAFISFDSVEQQPGTGLIITAENDDYAPPDLVDTLVDRWRITPQVKVIPNTDHFYGGALDKLEEVLSDYF